MEGRREQQIRESCSRIVRLYYGRGDAAACAELISCLAPEFSWVGTADGMLASGRAEAAAHFRRAAVPHCTVTEETYAVSEPAPGLYVCSGSVHLSVSISQETAAEQRQHVTVLLRREGEALLCTHLHAATPDREVPKGAFLSDGDFNYDLVNKRIAALEREVLDKRQKIDLILESVSGLLVSCRDDEELTFLKAGPRIAAFFGYSAEAFPDAARGCIQALIYPPDRARAVQERRESLKTGKLLSKYRMQCGDGSLKWVLFSGRRLAQDDGTPYIQGICLDISQTEEINQKLLEQRELLENIYDTIPYGIFRFVRKGGAYPLISINKAAMRLLDCGSMEEFEARWDVRTGVAGAVLPEDRHVLRSTYGELKNTGDRKDVAYRSVWRDGTVHWLQGFNMLVGRDRDGNDIIQRMMSDTTQTRQLSDQVELEQKLRMVEQASRRALEEAYEAANRANQAKSAFLSQMSHDIRTPMNAIVGMTAIARRRLDDREQVLHCIETIERSGRQLLNLINEVLDMSKIESQEFTMREAPFSVEEAVRETAEIVRVSAEERGQELRLELGAFRHPSVVGDRGRLQQILSNFLSNAVKYTGEGGHILLSAEERESPAGSDVCAVFVIQDDGIGMSEEFQKKMFQPFERADDPRVSKIQGTGLGMAIAQNLVRMMNGSIHVESALNRGTRFTVTLLFKRDGADPPCAAQQDAPEEPERSGRPGFTDAPLVLLAEDNPLNREIARFALDELGVRTEEAEDGAVCLEKFRASAPGYYRAVLMDVQMPGMDGYEACRAIRALDRPDARQIPIIALTANAYSEDVQNALNAGMNAHLSKPLDAVQLDKTLKRCLR